MRARVGSRRASGRARTPESKPDMAGGLSTAGTPAGLRSFLRAGGAGPVWLLSAAIIAFGVSFHATLGHSIQPLDPSFSLPWYILAVAFGLAEIHVVHLRFRREAHSF